MSHTYHATAINNNMMSNKSSSIAYYYYSSSSLRCFLSSLIPLLLIIGQQTAEASSPPFLPQTVKRFITSRCQNPVTPSSAIWSWEGHLVDPSNGNVIANVEGIELVRVLSEIEKPILPPSTPSSSKSISVKENDEARSYSLWNVARGLRRLHDLKVKKMLTTDRNWDYAGTVLSRKLFCYSHVSGDSKGSLLKEYKHHHNAPIRKIENDEAIALFDTATTFVSRNEGNEMHMITEWPDGRWIQSSASAGLVASDNNDGGSEYYHDIITNSKKKKAKAGKQLPFAYTAYVRCSGKGKLPSLPEKTPKNELDNNYDDHTNTIKNSEKKKKSSIPRSKFIQFGKDEDSENNRYGARETYSYILGSEDRMSRPKRYIRSIKESIASLGEEIGLWDFNFDHSNNGRDGSSTTVQYVRYGEAPPFYAPGKMCTLELVGKRVDSVTDAPPLAATLAATRVPGFMSVHTPIVCNSIDFKNLKSKRGKRLDENKLQEMMIEDTAAINAVNWFRGNEGSLPLQVLPENDGQEEEEFFTNVISKGLNALYRIRAAATLTAATEY